MTKITKILGVVVVAALLCVAASPAYAGCLPGKVVSTFGNGGDVSWTPTGAFDSAAVTGRFWQQGSRSLANEGTCAGFLYEFGGGISMNQFLGDACVTGCPAGQILTLAQVPSTDGARSFFLVASVGEVSGPPTDFAYENLGPLAMIELPRPSVATSARAGSLVNLNVNLAAVGTGVYGPGASSTITGYRVLSAAGATDPGRLASAYPALEASVASTGAAASGVALDVDCSNQATDRWVVTQLQLDGGVFSDLVSAAVRVNCNPNLAEPRFKIIDKKPAGKKEIGRN